MSDPQVYVRGFGKNCREADLKQLFGKYGSVEQVRIIRDYAFIVFKNRQEVEEAVKNMDGQKFQDNRLRVEIAGKPKKTKGPQPNDQCRYCHRLGHWQNNCPEYRQRRGPRERRRRRSYSSSSSSSSSESDRSRRNRRKTKKVKKSHRKRSYSSSSSSSSQSSSSRSSSGQKQVRRDKSKQQVEKDRNHD